jgi:hypothetical protein
MSRSPRRPSPVDAGAFCRRSSRRRRRPARSPRSGHRETDHYSLRHEHVPCSRTQASRTPRRDKACFRRSRRLNTGLRRRFVVSPRLDSRFRGDDTCWLGRWRCSSCFSGSPEASWMAAQLKRLAAPPKPSTAANGALQHFSCASQRSVLKERRKSREYRSRSQPYWSSHAAFRSKKPSRNQGRLSRNMGDGSVQRRRNLQRAITPRFLSRGYEQRSLDYASSRLTRLSGLRRPSGVSLGLVRQASAAEISRRRHKGRWIENGSRRPGRRIFFFLLIRNKLNSRSRAFGVGPLP